MDTMFAFFKFLIWAGGWIIGVAAAFAVILFVLFCIFRAATAGYFSAKEFDKKQKEKDNE